MKRIHTVLFAGMALLVALASCNKAGIKPVLVNPASGPTLSSSASTLVLDSTNASSTHAVTFTWDSLNYGAQVAVDYSLQVDSANGTFAKPASYDMGDTLSKAFSEADLNDLALSLGLQPDSAGTLQVRIVANVPGINNARQDVPSSISKVLTLTVTPYSTKPKPKYPVPAGLYIVGNATPGGWSNPVPVPSQQFTQIDDHTFGIIINLTGGGQFLLLPVNGDWSHKYALTNADLASPTIKSGGNFTPDAPNNMPGPDVSGLYKIIVDFVKGTYTITPVDPTTIPSNLYIVGDATAGGWNNPVPVPSQQFTATSAYTFSITLPLTGGKQYLFLPVNGSWTHKYSVTDNTIASLKQGGTFKEDAPDNFPGPDASGTYKIDVNFLTMQYTVTAQ